RDPLLGSAPGSAGHQFCRISDIPIAEISGASRVELRDPLLGSAPGSAGHQFCRISDIPIAEISGASRV
ncbi:hypothetical protein CQA81_31910, partial [Klebsiella pneumoniae]